MTRIGILVLACLLQGCLFSERSFPHDEATFVPVKPAPEGQRPGAKDWLAQAAPTLAHLLPHTFPHHDTPALLTDQLRTPEGKGADVVSHFHIKVGRLERLVDNFWGLAYSAQATMTRSTTERSPCWEGFEEVWVPIQDDLQLSGRLGWARDAGGNIADADCIVILPGIRGDNNVVRVRDLALALRKSGFHVLSVEMRGAGLTDKRFPEYEYTWGVFETDDLLRVADWLQSRPHVRRTGLIGYSWGGNQGIHAAWAEGRTRDGVGVCPRLGKLQSPPPRGPKRYQAGVIAVSPLPRYEELLDVMETEQSPLIHPVVAGLQATIRDRMVARGYPNPSGNVRELLKNSITAYPNAHLDGLEFMRIMPFKGAPTFDRMNGVRVPLLILHAADDMVAPAQDLADLMATTVNPNVAAILLPGGGHIGISPYAPAWYYSMILNFFSPTAGPVPVAWQGGTP